MACEGLKRFFGFRRKGSESAKAVEPAEEVWDFSGMTNEELLSRRKELGHFIWMSKTYGGADGGIDGAEREEMKKELKAIEKELSRRGCVYW